MIAEPYICIEGFRHSEGEVKTGRIVWFSDKDRPSHYAFTPYADFEREKLKELDVYPCDGIDVDVKNGYGYVLLIKHQQTYSSHIEINYRGIQYAEDCESGRLLKRAEFLKAVCEKEGVEWLPEIKDDSIAKLSRGECSHTPGNFCKDCVSTQPTVNKISDKKMTVNVNITGREILEQFVEFLNRQD